MRCSRSTSPPSSCSRASSAPGCSSGGPGRSSSSRRSCRSRAESPCRATPPARVASPSLRRPSPTNGQHPASTSTRSHPGTSQQTTPRRSKTIPVRSAQILQRIPAGRWGDAGRHRRCGAVPRVHCGRLCSRCGAAGRRWMARAMTDWVATSRAVLGHRGVPVVVLREIETAVPGANALCRGRLGGCRGHLPDGGRRRRDSGASPPRRMCSSGPARSCGRSRSTTRSKRVPRFIVTPGLSVMARAVPARQAPVRFRRRGGGRVGGDLRIAESEVGVKAARTTG